MKIKSKVVTFVSTLVASLVSVNVFALDVDLADSKWDGKLIPQGQQCQKFGGIEPATPRLLVTSIPKAVIQHPILAFLFSLNYAQKC